MWIVLAINIVIALGFFGFGYFGDSSALIANGFDGASDSFVFAISIFALERGKKWKDRAAQISGLTLLVFAVVILVDAGRKYLGGSEPVGPMMLAMSIAAAVGNLLSYFLLKRLRHKDVNLRAATTFSFNDFASNGGVLVAGLLVMWTGKNWPDLVVAIGVAIVATFGGIEILRDAKATTARHKQG